MVAHAERESADGGAIEVLAQTLFAKMERLDPTEDGDKGWSDLTDHQRDFYRLCVKAILAEREVVAQALR